MPEGLTIDVDATLITSHSEKKQAAGNYKGGFGFHRLQAYLDETREALGGLLRPGERGLQPRAEDHRAVDLALAQIPAEYIERLGILVRADSAGATHGFVDYCREGNMRFSAGYEPTSRSAPRSSRSPRIRERQRSIRMARSARTAKSRRSQT